MLSPLDFGPELIDIYNEEVKAYCNKEMKKMIKEHLEKKQKNEKLKKEASSKPKAIHFGFTCFVCKT